MVPKDVENVGRAVDVKDVADGSGRNFVLRRKLAVRAGTGVETEAKRLKDAAVKRETKDRVEAQALADEIDNKTVVVRLKVGAGDKAFGSITKQSIAAALKAQHRGEMERHKTDMKEPIRTMGEHEASRSSCRRWGCSTGWAAARSSPRCRARCRPRRTSSTTAGSSRKRLTSGG